MDFKIWFFVTMHSHLDYIQFTVILRTIMSFFSTTGYMFIYVYYSGPNIKFPLQKQLFFGYVFIPFNNNSNKTCTSLKFSSKNIFTNILLFILYSSFIENVYNYHWKCIDSWKVSIFGYAIWNLTKVNEFPILLPWGKNRGDRHISMKTANFTLT